MSTRPQYIGNINFILLGISNIISWNVILTSLDFFQDRFPQINISFYIPIPFYVGSIFKCLFFPITKINLGLNIFGLLIYPIAKYLSLKMRLNISFLFITVLLLLIPILSAILSGTIGIIVNFSLVFLFGAFTSIAQSSAIAFASIFTQDIFLTLYITGNGLAGVLICLLRLLVVVFFGTTKRDVMIGCLTFFVLSTIILLISFLLYLHFFSYRYCTFFLNKTKIKSFHNQNPFMTQFILTDKEKIKSIKDVVALQKSFFEESETQQIVLELHHSKNFIFSLEEENGEEVEEGNIPQQQIINQKDLFEDQNINPLLSPSINSINSPDLSAKKKKKFSNWQFFVYIMKKIYPMAISILVQYIQTFQLFPGVIVNKSKVEGISRTYQFVLLPLYFNTFDTMGKYLSQYRWYKLWHILTLLIVRFIFVGSVLSNAIFRENPQPFISNNYFLLTMLFFFAISNGFAYGANLNLASFSVKDDERETVIFLMTFLRSLGICIGLVIGLSYAEI